MAIIKCKMCGGDLNIVEGESVCECEYCGTRQTIPSADNEKKLTLFARANRLRLASEFDKAFGIYESIVADFPEEAEAYWGLVLCKYGIEYVDDPATGKKIPTCHRSSFDSVMEDSDFEQACENADGTARRVYREEAKQIEEIRKGILEVSGREEPYDIFICYKETDENGERTLDSVLAQDIYDALTDKGYRVFFARITLEDKLGQEYEPYIFAALNSAKIMLAVGTDYEYYNAVWVKNEWSRYLKLMAKDKDKHLIPCYKNLDAYDMPKEFAKLQAQDLGKVGAIQDLLRGIEKLLDSEMKNASVQETVVLQQGGSNINSLLDRGNMALEDREWQKADGFFEEVLNQNSRCADAYLGKLLAAMEASSFDNLISQKIKEAKSMIGETRTLPEDREYIERKIAEYNGDKVLEDNALSDRYDFNREYIVYAPYKKRKLDDEREFWNSQRDFSRFMQFTNKEVVELMQRKIDAVYEVLEHELKAAETLDHESLAKLQKSYQLFLEKTSESIKKEHDLALAKYEDTYKRLCENLDTTSDLNELRELQNSIQKLEGYKDSESLSEAYQKKYQEIQTQLFENQRREYRMKNGVCLYCGGSFRGGIIKRCIQCGKIKNY